MHSATIAGLGFFASFGLSLGVLIFILFSAAGDFGGAIAGGVVLLLSVAFSPILATIVGGIIGSNYDDGVTAMGNGALVGALGTVIMVVVTVLAVIMASGEESPDLGEFAEMLIIAVPAAVGGASGAFFGCTFLDMSGETSTRLSSRGETSASFGTERWQGGHHDLTRRSAPIFGASGQTQTTIRCPSCGSNMTVPKLGQLQKVKCDSCGTEGEIKN